MKLDEHYLYGRWGKYQTLQAAFVFFHIWQAGFQLLIGVFIGYRPDFQCAASELDNKYITNGSIYLTYEKCHINVFHNNTNDPIPQLIATKECTNGYQYQLDKDSTIVTQFDLVCGRANLAELLQTLVMAGQLVGAACASSLSDRFGRKIVHLVCNLSILILGISVAFVSNYTVLAVMKFIIGVLQQGIVMAGVVYTLELFPEQTRYSSELFGSFIWSTGLVVMSSIAFLLRHYSWRHLQIVLSCFSLLSVVQYWIQDESLRWLVVNGKRKEVERIVRKVAKWNKLNYEDLMKIVNKNLASKRSDYEESGDKLLEKDHEESGDKLLEKDHEESGDKLLEKNHEESGDKLLEKVHEESGDKLLEKVHEESGDKLLEKVHELDTFRVEKYSIITIFKHKSIFVVTIMMCFTWVTNTVTYFGLTLTSTSLAGNRFLNFFLMSCVEYISLVLEYLTLRNLGRRTTSIIFHTITGTSLALATLLKYFSDGDETLVLLSIIATFSGKMSVTGSFSVLFLFTPELYPTNLRNVGIGTCSTLSRIGAMLAPFAGTLTRAVPWAPGTIFASMCFIVTIIMLYLPETRGMDLPQTLADVKVWYKKNTGIRLRKGRQKHSLKDEGICIVVESKPLDD